MKNLSLILNAILFVAVAVLFYLHFSTGQKILTEGDEDEQPQSSLAFVNSDTLLNNFEYYNEIKKDLDIKRIKLETDITSRRSSLEREYMQYQQNAQAGKLTMDQAKKIEEGLMKRQQSLMAYQESKLTQMAEEEQAMNKKLYEMLEKYIKEYNKGPNYDFILGYQRGGGILLANDRLDVTKDVLKGLNEMDIEEKE